MAKNPPPGDGHRVGAVRERSQTYNPHTERWVKRDTETGKFIDQKADPKPFKGATRDNNTPLRRDFFFRRKRPLQLLASCARCE